MSDKSEKFRNIPVIRGMLADPMKTSREIEELKDLFKKKLQENPGLNDVKISNDSLSEVVSNAILHNQKDYEIMGSNMEDLSDTMQNIGMDIQFGVSDMINEMQGARKQMKIKNNIAKKRMKQNETTNENLYGINQGINDTNTSLEDLKLKLINEFSKTQQYLSDIHSSADRIGEVSYGTRIPEKKSIHEIMENPSFESKKTLLALYAKGLVYNNGSDNENPLHLIFSYHFHEYLRLGNTSREAKQICEEKKEKTKELKEEYASTYNTLKSEEKSGSYIFEELTSLRDKISQASRGLITDEEIELLDVYYEAKKAGSIIDLINMGLLDDTTLEKLVRHQKVDGQVSLELSRILKMDKNGINPKLDLDGDVGRLGHLRAQTMQGNIALKQRQAMLESLEEGNELTKITNEILLEVKNDLSDALHTIGDTLTYGFNEITEELQQQTQILENINRNLLHPLDIKANEFYTHGAYRAKLKERKSAFESFRKGLNEKSIHLGNLYGAGIAKKMLGEDKEAGKYLLQAYKIASHESKHELAGKIALDIAKINIKYLRLKLAKRWLNEVVLHDQENIEARLLKARLTKLLNQKEEFLELLQYISDKIILEGKDFSLVGNYSDVLKYVYEPIIQQSIANGSKASLLKILPHMVKTGYISGMKESLSSLMFDFPQKVMNMGLEVQKIIASDKSFFDKKYQEFANQKFMGGTSDNFFTIAYLGYQNVNFDSIKRIIEIGLEYDMDYIRLKTSPDMQTKKIYKDTVLRKISALGPNAKYMLRDYLQYNSSSLLTL